MPLLRWKSVLIGLSVLTALAAAPIASRAEEPQLAAAPVHQSEQFYFVLPDRFANGDTGNDRGGLSGDRTRTGYDPADKGFYHGGDLKGVMEKLDYIQGLGTTAIWLAPVFKNQPVQGDSAGYHGYWITDFTQVDPHFGTNDDLKRLVKLAHQRGIKIFLDVIVNHTADVISYRENQYSYVDKKTSPYTDSQGRAFDDANYADGRNGWPQTDANAGPYTPVVNGNVKKPNWLNDPSMYHNRGDSTFSGENSTYGDFYGLDDLWTERPEVVRGMTKVYQDWVRETNVDGFRLDTAKHVDMEFWPQFAQGIHDVAKPGFFMFGEVYSADPAIESSYVRQGQLDATLDFGFQAAAQGFVTGGSGQGLADLYAADSLYTARGVNAGDLPTFLGNHDMGRIGHFVSTLEQDKLAHELMFLTRGQPVVYSGDEQGFTGAGGDKDARQDMFASRTADYLDDDLLGTENTHAQDNYDPAHPLYRAIAELAQLRKSHPGLRDGAQTTRYAGNNVFAFSRVGSDRVEYLVAANSSTSPRTVTVDAFSGAGFSRIYGTGSIDGRSITIPAQSTVVFRADQPIATPDAAPAIALHVPAHAATAAAISADVSGDPLATVTFSAQVGNGPWQVLGTARGAPYAVQHDLNGLAGGARVRYQAKVRDGRGRTATASGELSVSTPAQAAQRDYVLVHYQRPAGDYADWRLYTWGDTDSSMQLPWPQGQPFAGEDAYGRFAWVKVKPGATHVGFLVIDSNGTKDVEQDRSLDPSRTFEIWLKQGEPALQPPPAPTAPQDGYAVLHYRRTDANYAGWGLHLWDGNSNPVEWGSPMQPTGTDAFGAYWKIPLVAGATGVSYIVHNGDAKDLPNDQRLDFATFGREAWILSGRQAYLRPEVKTQGRDVDITKSAAQWLDRGTIAWNKHDTDGKVYELVTAAHGGLSVVDGQLHGDFTTQPLNARHDGLTEAQRGRFPNLWAYSAFGFSGDARAALKSQLVIAEKDTDGNLLAATGVQIPGALDDLYAPAAQAELGATFREGRPTLAVWAPTALNVRLDLDGSTVDMRRDDSTGVWRVTGPASWRGKHYRYQVTTWQGTASATDPYSVALTPDSTWSVLADLYSGPRSLIRPPAYSTGERAQIQELSVRDFSIEDPTVPSGHRGTYLAFTDTGSDGMRHLRELAQAGVTHVHLLPVFDFATIPELRSNQAQPACDLPSLAKDSAAQQECIAAVRATDGYNWGYDPLHYTVPEGGYATSPDGVTRNREFQSMVDGLHQAGLRVVMDVVYNHTATPSNLDTLVPGYYHRLLDDGTVANSTCCANTAPEHAMMGKLVVDSVVTWAKLYKVDGFRFDLMGHHPKDNILAVRAALDRLPGGRDILLYGEGWNFGEVANNARFVQATQANMAGTGVGTFNDRLRDAVRGGGPFDGNPRIQGFGSGLYTDPNGDPVNGTPAEQKARLLHYQDLVKVGLSGNLAGFTFTDASGRTVKGSEVDYNGSPAGYTASPAESVNYVDAHDNEILFDALAYKLPASTSAADRARMQVLSLATVVFSQGTGFATAGSDVLRSKSLDKNSYDSGDWFNAIHWNCADGNGFGRGLPPAWDNQSRWDYARPLLTSVSTDCAAASLSSARFAELLRLRDSSPLFNLSTLEQVQRTVSFPGPATPGVITMKLSGGPGPGQSVVVVFNATPSSASVPMAGSWRLAPGQTADPLLASAAYSGGAFSVPGRSVAVFVSR